MWSVSSRKMTREGCYLLRHCQIVWSTVRHPPRPSRMSLISSVTPALWALLLPFESQRLPPTRQRTFSFWVSSSPRQGPHVPGPYGLLWELGWQFIRGCRRPGGILPVRFSASGGFVALTGANSVVVSADRSLRHTGREGSGEGRPSLYSLTFLTPCPLWWLLRRGKMSLIYIKRKAKYVLFRLWKFFLPLLFSSSHFIFCRRHAHRHKEPEKSSKPLNRHGNWISCHLLPLPYPVLQVSDRSLSLYPWTAMCGHEACKASLQRD